eukprot:gnl/Chilomastix_caulleri/4994.p4 GENE.gnl/Chilomastix_caulleri/4994~~gnl/Chilomastix_caulleri/4994.p4  ORF type:complete len:68 (+),score=27.28 gnl/Chilomastix_caulleri/4994:294-497(+)
MQQQQQQQPERTPKCQKCKELEKTVEKLAGVVSDDLQTMDTAIDTYKTNVSNSRERQLQTSNGRQMS